MQRAMKIVVSALLTVAASTAMSAVTGMKYISTPGDYIGQGQTKTFTPPTATITAHDATTSVVHVEVSDPTDSWTLDFAAPQGVALANTSFPDAARYPFQSPMGAGLSMYGDGRGCNTLKGWFQVREYVLNSAGTVKKLAIDFVQNCEESMPPLYGAVRINSSIPLTVPETAAVAGRDFAVVSGLGASLDATQSFSRKHAPLTYRWTQVAGPAVVLDNPASATPSFTAPGVDTNTTLDFRLDVTNSVGDVSSDDTVVIVEGASTPRTSFDFTGDSGDFISQGHGWHFDTFNATITASRNFDNGVSASIGGDTWWSFDTAVPSGKAYRPGVYRNAVRFPFQGATVPGLDLEGDGRGCNTLTGQFTVYQVQFDTAGNPTMADITFTQHCEGGSSASRGEFLLNAVPHAVLARQLSEARKRFPRH
jgi:hypothetical protein